MKNFFATGPIVSSMLRNKTGAILVALQVALCLAILVNAAYIVHLRLEVAARPSGIADELTAFRVSISNQKLGGHEDQIAMQKREAAVIAAVPGVLAVARVDSLPTSRSGSSSGISADRSQSNPTATAGIYLSSDSLVKTWAMKLVEGRDFQADDLMELDASVSKDFPKTGIVSLSLARKLYPNTQNFVGKEFYIGTGQGANALRIVGVVETLQTPSAQAGEKGEYAVLVPVRLSNYAFFAYSVKTAAGQRDRVMKDVDFALRKSTSDPINVNLRSVEEMRVDRYRAERGLAWMLLTVSVLLVIVMLSGIVGMCSLWVAQRRKMIGVRRALGAQRSDILIYFMSENCLITTIGIGLGVLCALGLNQVLIAQFELPKLPMSYLVIAPLLFWPLGLAAVLAPAWRAANTAPSIATRSV